MDQPGTASSQLLGAWESPTPSTRTATDSAPAMPCGNVNLAFHQAMMEGLKRAHEDEEFRKEVAKHLS